VKDSVNPSASDLAPHELPTPPEFKGHRHARDAAQRCYELTSRFVAKYPQCDLVHGLCGHLGDSYGHAWAEIGDIVYDGTCKGFFERAGFYAVVEAQPVRRFVGGKEYAAWMLEANSWGPCPELAAAERSAHGH
jgi:hypothetical protein